jgi:hypothetical protein
MADPQTISPADARSIAKDACIYGYPIVDSYRISAAGRPETTVGPI